MNSVTCNFTYTTVDEQRNYFSGEVQNIDAGNYNEDILPAGVYRVIDGKLSRIITGSSPNVIKVHFDNIAKKNE